MELYSTNNKSVRVSLKEAVIQGLAPDNGLYMPLSISKLSDEFFKKLSGRPFNEMAFDVVRNLIGNDIPTNELKKIVNHTISFDAPLVEIEPNVFALELFHGPTLAFKDFGARFLAGLFGYFASQQKSEVVILVATSGDTGSAVANGFLNVPGTRVVVLYPSGKVSEIQEKQFTTLGANITALEVDGTFDDCQRLVKQAFLDDELKQKLFLTSANSINIGRLIPQMLYYFQAYSQLKKKDKVIFSVPSGNFGNLTAGLLARRMGLPIHHFIASTNENDVVPQYLQSGVFTARSSKSTISNAMDVGNPSNFVRMLDLYNNDHSLLSKEITGYRFSDDETEAAMKQVFQSKAYTLDPHGAVGYLGLKKYQSQHPNTTGIFLETAHPAKFKEVVEKVVGPIAVPEKLKVFLKSEKRTTKMSKDFNSFRDFLNSF
jgi:threonine synthase